ncbi:UDP-N-acetylglucosamine--N-acetylmuramyl-(pentapeptide) pyrophosphoryl-undecaprenol N-acetylglucosamine transferase [Cryptosporangium minutisporangium]|uniref:UDP-N-acetylglucosamine--N-acetylmuramyl-(pentapeptide) pyrophosphoryl-undecaprenol N-acetylglucosamine transferase n=1 Tax=Cryptosporangium minutisporangium TaxID=113569 RepID=A0ABP6T0B8_9ACTN
MTALRSVVLAGGGTGGHIEPALALAECIRRYHPDARITCLGTPKGLETEIIPARGWDLELVPAYPLPRRPNADLARTPGRVRRSVAAVAEVLDRVDAEVVIGFGGYVALPAYLAARRKKLPLVVHEVNDPAGVANKVGARLTPFVGLGGDHVTLRHGTVVGVPLRRGIATLDRAAARAAAREHFGLDQDKPVLFVSGGSQGAHSINLAVTAAAGALGAAGIQVLHVIGARNTLDIMPERTGSKYVTLPFLDRMDLGYAAADVMLCRGGALTCAEVAAVGLPAVYVPYPHGNGEQRRNALPVTRAGGGLLVEDAELSASWLEENVIPLLGEPDRIAAMGRAAAGYGRRDGDEALLALVYQAVRENQRAEERA